MLRTPPPNADLARLESYGPEELLNLFATCLKNGTTRSAYISLPDAWGRLFDALFLSAEELVEEMERGSGGLDVEHARMLREFIHADRLNGGLFVLDVIKNGGKTDRAALIMVADPGDLAAIEQNGMTAVHLLAGACDRRIRPALIRRAGKRILAGVFDQRGLPVLFTIFGLCDLGTEDLDAIASVFSRDELRAVMSESRSGNNALEVFQHLEASMKRYPRMERNALVRNAFYRPAAKDTRKEGTEPPVRVEKIAGSAGRERDGEKPSGDAREGTGG